MSKLVFAFALLSLLMLFTACRQDDGNACSVNDDCGKDRVCCLAAPGDDRGVCAILSECTYDGGLPDGGEDSGSDASGD